VLRYSPHIRLLAKAIEQGRMGRIFHDGISDNEKFAQAILEDPKYDG
jgi:predicted dehydrogenase